MRTRKLWTPAEVQLLAELYPMTPMAEIQRQLNRSIPSIYGQVEKQGLKRSPDFFNTPASGRLDGEKGTSTRFQKGQRSWNKGKKGMITGGVPTQFKPGSLPHNTKEDGAISIRMDKKGRPYRHIRIAQGKWVHLHRYVWEQANGPVPPGYIVKFKDGNLGNCVLENLYLSTRKENMSDNTIHNYPIELKQTIRTLGKLKRTIKHATEQNNRSSESPL
jgi:hypothetical protein